MATPIRNTHQADTEATAAAASAPRARPEIQCNNRQLRDVVSDVWRVVRAANRGRRPKLFTQDGRLVRLRRGERGPVIHEVGEAGAIGYLARVADWVSRRTKKTEEGDFIEVTTSVPPPKVVAQDIIEYPDPRLPILESVVGSPVFDRHGTLIASPGYHAEARLWFDDAGLLIPDVPDRPSAADVEDATRLLLDDLLVGFRFVAPSDRAHALAALLLVPLRRMISGSTPIHLVEAPSPGTGKGLFADVVSLVSLGRNAEATTLPRDGEEVRKKITAVLSRGAPIVSLDNLIELDSTELAAAITANPWADRVLGSQRMIVLPNNALWLATANNPELSLEMARRCVRVRIDPETDRPWERTGFKHPDLRKWTREHRAELVRALLIWVKAWISAGCPEAKKKLGSFEAWAAVVGGVLEHVGIPGFLANTEELYAMADTEGQQWRAFCAAWWLRCEGQWMKASALLEHVVERNDDLDILGDSKERVKLSQRQKSTRLGQAIKKRRDRQFGQWKICVTWDAHDEVNIFRLEQVEAKRQEPAAPQLAMNLDDSPESNGGVYRRSSSMGRVARLRRKRSSPNQLWLSPRWEALYAA